MACKRIPRSERKNAHDHQAGSQSTDNLPSCSYFISLTGKDKLPLQLSGRWILLAAGTCQLGFGLAQFLSPQQATGVLVMFPVQSFNLERSVIFQPFIVGVNGFLDFLDRLIKIILGLPAEDEVAPVDLLFLRLRSKPLGNPVYLLIFNVSNKDRKDALAVLHCVGDLLVKHFGGDRSRAPQEEEGICLLDASIDLLLPVFPFGDAFPIDPSIELIESQHIDDLLCGVKISARVGDEDV